ncbi:MAG: urea ABC transporter substrate-binding protein [Cyanobacteria bacterium P01_A01_bin.17]
MLSVGILHSLTGAMALSEQALKDAALMAIAEINQSGGVLGQSLNPVLEDGASDPEIFAQRALKLVEQDKVAALFGCWTSSSRKAVQPVVEAHNILLWYPLQYEGLECSPNIFYTGSCPNQQVAPAVDWLVKNKGKRFYLLGSDYIFPWTVNKLIAAQLRSHSGTISGETYVPLGHQDFSVIIQDIQQNQPDVVFNTLNGDSNLAFYRNYAQAGLTATDIPIMAVSIAEVELRMIGAAATGHYASWSYFQSLELASNQQFVQKFQASYGTDRVTSDPIEAAYAQVYLWKQAVENAQSWQSDRVRSAAYGQIFSAPGGEIKIDKNHHVWKPCRIGKIQPDGQIKSVFVTDIIRPLPWLGVEEQDFGNATVVTQLLSEVSSWIQKTQQLEVTLERLKQEMHERQQAEAALKKSQTALARAEAELEITHRLQTMLLPSEEELQDVPDLEMAGFMEPAETVGGDYYEVLQHNGKVHIGIGDVTGHGLESSVVMMIAQIAIRTLIQTEEEDRTKVLNTVNRLLYENVRRMQIHRHMTLMLLEYCAGTLHFYGQHEDLVIVRQDGQTQQIETLELGFPLGIEPDITPLITEDSVELQPGDLVVLYTDGVTEAMNLGDQQYGLDQLCTVLQQNHQRPAVEIRQAVIADLKQHIGSQEVFDDITLLIFKQR